ncbi:hypothetical protein J6590_044913 [Homalodisca vitripennis]|nr:hypothetical protein J6590_044913 [Homalodisca vitripennis]
MFGVNSYGVVSRLNKKGPRTQLRHLSPLCRRSSFLLLRKSETLHGSPICLQCKTPFLEPVPGRRGEVVLALAGRVDSYG